MPAGIAFGPDGRAYVAMFTRRPQIRRSAWVAAIDRQGSIERVMLGLTMAIDVAFDSRGRLHALEFSQDFDLNLPSLYDPIGGRIVRGRGWRTEVIAHSLPFPTSMAFGPDGYCHVALNGAFGTHGAGWIGRFSPPE